MFGTGLLLRVAREIDKAARAQLEQDRDELMRQLRALHHAIERGELTEEEFEAREEQLLDRLEQIRVQLQS